MALGPPDESDPDGEFEPDDRPIRSAATPAMPAVRRPPPPIPPPPVYQTPYLSVEERTVLIVRHHVAQLWRPGLLAIVALIAALLFSPTTGSSGLSNVLWMVALALLLWLGLRTWLWYVDSIVVTDKRIFEVSGIITKNVASMPLRMLTDVTYRRSLGGRVLGYGTLIVESAGQDQALSRIDYLPEPDEFYRTITTLVFQ